MLKKDDLVGSGFRLQRIELNSNFYLFQPK